MKLSGLLLFGLVASVSAQDKAQPKPTYESMVERAKAGDKTVDFRALRLAYADSPNYSTGPDVSEQKKSMSAALNNKDFDKAIKNADAVLASNFVDIDAHFVEYIAHRELKQEEASEFHKAIAQGLLKSITESGDGKTPDTAFQVIEVHEEYVLLHFMGGITQVAVATKKEWPFLRPDNVRRSAIKARSQTLLQRRYSYEARPVTNYLLRLTVALR